MKVSFEAPTSGTNGVSPNQDVPPLASGSEGGLGSVSPVSTWSTPLDANSVAISAPKSNGENVAAQDVRVKVEPETDVMDFLDVTDVSLLAPQQQADPMTLIPELDLPDLYPIADKPSELSMPTFDWDPSSLFREEEGRGQFPWYLSGSA
jgi:hypothetical protein